MGAPGTGEIAKSLAVNLKAALAGVDTPIVPSNKA